MIIADLNECLGWQAAVGNKFLRCQQTAHIVVTCGGSIVFGFTVVADPHFFQAGTSKTSGVSLDSMFMATAPPREIPTITSGWCWSYSAWAIRTDSSKSSSGSWVEYVVAVVFQVCWFEATWGRVPAVEEEDFHRRILQNHSEAG